MLAEEQASKRLFEMASEKLVEAGIKIICELLCTEYICHTEKQ